jgi:hypothetical protein
MRLLCIEVYGNELAVRRDDFEFMVDFYYHAFVGVLMKWIDTGMAESPESLVLHWAAMVDETMEHFMRNLSRPHDGAGYPSASSASHTNVDLCVKSRR